MSETCSRPHRRHKRLAVALTVALTLSTACGDDAPDDGAQPATSTTAPATTTSTSSTTSSPTTTTSTAPAESPEQEVIDRYVAFWAARFEANTGMPDPDHPGLAEYATGAQLDNVIAETQGHLDDGLALQQRDAPASFQKVTVVSIDGDTAIVQECYVDDALVVRRDTGAVVDDSITTQNIQGTLQRVDGKWRVAGTELLQESEGVSGCALAS